MAKCWNCDTKFTHGINLEKKHHPFEKIERGDIECLHFCKNCGIVKRVFDSQ